MTNSKNIKKWQIWLFFFGMIWVICMSSCGQKKESLISQNQNTADISPELIFERKLELDYAEEFSVSYYQDGYILLSVSDGSRFLLVPEGKDVPKEVEKGIVLLRQPVNQIYLAASAVMDMFSSLDALDQLRLSGLKKEGWYIEGAKEAMEEGKLLYAGKYNMPDYELIVSEGCCLAIENTMIHHAPEVMEKLEGFKIPVMIDYSSYEDHPLGRVEWIKFYGALTGKEELAEEIFEAQKEVVNRAASQENTEKTAAFFYLPSNGSVNIRKSFDYIPKMIELAGGRYVFHDFGDKESRSSSANIQVEEFYAAAKQADILIYNSAVDGGISSIEELIGQCSVLKDCKAVQEGNVWCASADIYQRSMAVGAMTADFHQIFTNPDCSDDEVQYLVRMK